MRKQDKLTKTKTTTSLKQFSFIYLIQITLTLFRLGCFGLRKAKFLLIPTATKGLNEKSLSHETWHEYKTRSIFVNKKKYMILISFLISTSSLMCIMLPLCMCSFNPLSAEHFLKITKNLMKKKGIL